MSDPGTSAMISYSTAKRMSEYYNQDVGKKYINGDTNMLDALSITFPMAQLKNFIWTVERMVCTNNCSAMQLGVKVYYGKYPQETGTTDASWDLDSLPKEYANRHSLFFVPVIRESGENLWQVFDPAFPVEDCRYPAEPIRGDTTKPFAYIFFNSPIVPADANNHGGLRPPPFDESPLTFPR
jgi:hypothetical protein